MASGVVVRVNSQSEIWQTGTVRDNSERRVYPFIQDLRVKGPVSARQAVEYTYLDISEEEDSSIEDPESTGVPKARTTSPTRKVAVDLD